MQQALLAAVEETTNRGSGFGPGLIALLIGGAMTVWGVARNASKRKGGFLVSVGLIVLLLGVGTMLFVK